MTGSDTTMNSRITSEKDRLVRMLRTIALVLAVSTATFAFRPTSTMVHRPIVEDGYYALSVAANVAAGKGVTIDGVHLTNGFQPLFTLLCVPAFMLAGGDRVLAMRFVLVLHWLVLIATALLLGRIARRMSGASAQEGNRIFWWTVVVYLSSILVLVVSFNGLETGLVLLLYATAWWRFQAVSLDTWKDLSVFSVLLGLMVLARIDAFFFVVVVGLSEFLKSGQDVVRRFTRASVMAGIVILVSSPWWIYNRTFFGAAMPSSGQAYRNFDVTFDRILEAIAALSRATMPVVYVGQNTLEGVLPLLARTALLVAFLWYLQKEARVSRFLENMTADVRRSIRFAFLMICGMLFLAISYTASFSAVWFYTRYFSPLVVVSCVFLGVAAARLTNNYPRLLSFVALALGVPLLGVVIRLDAGSYQSAFINDQLALVRSQVPDSASVAAFQTGTLGYFRDRVVNLDGKVNPEAIQNRSNLLAYVERQGVRWMCDEEAGIEGTFPRDTLRIHGWKLVGKKGNFVLYWREAQPGARTIGEVRERELFLIPARQNPLTNRNPHPLD